MTYAQLREAVIPLLNNLVHGSFDIWSKEEIVDIIVDDVYLTIEGTNPEPRLLTTVTKRKLYDFFRTHSSKSTLPFAEDLPLTQNDTFLFDLRTRLEEHPVELFVAETIVESGVQSTNGIASLTGLSRRKVDLAKAKLRILLEDFL